jgi:hypothetical protein
VAERDIQEPLLRAALAVLQPYVPRLLRSGVTFGQLEAGLRSLFVEIAAREFAPGSSPPTDSRVSILTGINRKEVRRIRARGAPAAPRSFSRNVIASLVSRWISGAHTTGADGRPLPLPYDARRGPSFTALARKTTLDLHPRALLDALIAAGAAVLREGDVVALTRTAYVPQRGRPETLAMLADDPPELIETMLHNVLGEGDQARLQQKIAYDNIGSDGLERLRAALRREAARLLARSDAVLRRHDRDRSPRAPGGARTYAGIGIYYFEAPRDPRPQPRSLAPPARRRLRRRRNKS